MAINREQITKLKVLNLVTLFVQLKSDLDVKQTEVGVCLLSI
jgi:hypothetical protein